MYIKQLDIKEQFQIYKSIKAALIAQGLYSYEAIAAAMNSKVNDIEF